MTLKFLKNTALEWISKLPEPNRKRIQWIITVPANWNNAAEEMMREAAMKVNFIA